MSQTFFTDASKLTCLMSQMILNLVQFLLKDFPFFFSFFFYDIPIFGMGRKHVCYFCKLTFAWFPKGFSLDSRPAYSAPRVEGGKNHHSPSTLELTWSCIPHVTETH